MTAPRFAPTLAGALEARDQGLLAQWTQDFLRNAGDNVPLADGLLLEERVYFLAEVELEDICPICGPSPSFDYPESHDEYEERVDAMADSISQGWQPPPLIVHLPSLKLNDGSHRFEALLRLRSKHYWTILWMDKPPRAGHDQPPRG